MSAASAEVEVRPGGAEADVPARGRTRRADRLLLVLAVALPAGYVLWRIRDSFRYYMDDFYQFAVALDQGLSWELLGLNVFQHFGPANRLAHLFVLRVGDFSLAVGMLAVAALVALLQLSLWWLLHELRISAARTLVALVAVGFSIVVLDTAVWGDAAFHIFPALIATTAVVAAHVRAVRTGRRSWHAVSVVLFALGTLTQERGLFALPMVVLADWFLIGGGRPARERVRLLRSVLVPLAAMTAIALATAAYIYVFYAGGVSTRPTPATTARTVLGAFTEGIWPTWLGFRLQSLSPVPVQLALLALLVVIGILLLRVRRRNADAIGFFVGSFVLYYGFLAVSPLLNEDSVEATALRLHNLAYLLVPTAVAAAFLVFRRERTGPDETSREASPIGRSVVAAAVALAAVLVVTGGRFVESTWYAERAAHAYLDAVADEQAEWADPEATLLPLRVPTTLVDYWAEAYGRHELFLKFHDRTFLPGELGARPIVVDAEGQVRPVLLVREGELELPDQPCGPAQQRLVDSPVPVSGEPLFLQLTYLSSSEVPLRATAYYGSEPSGETPWNWQVPLAAGQHTVVVPLYSTDVSGVVLDALAPVEQLCVLQADIVRPVFADGDQCTDMTVYGEPAAVTTCPSGRPR